MFIPLLWFYEMLPEAMQVVKGEHLLSRGALQSCMPCCESDSHVSAVCQNGIVFALYELLGMKHESLSQN